MSQALEPQSSARKGLVSVRAAVRLKTSLQATSRTSQGLLTNARTSLSVTRIVPIIIERRHTEKALLHTQRRELAS